MRKINVGIIGAGTIGGGVAKTLLLKKSVFTKQLGVEISLSKVFDVDKKAIKALALKPSLVAKSIDDIVKNSEIDIVVELIGGLNPAKKFVLEALKNGKHVVTANKALLADSGKEIFKQAFRSKVAIKFEASVCGAMPIIKMIQESYVSNDIKAMYGIVNGTCNYISTKMIEDNCSFEDALNEAKQKGFAEADPTFDIEGYDACHKLNILAMLAFGNFVKEKDIYVEGIKHLQLQDISFARQWGYDIKLLAIAKKKKNKIELRVHPTLISLKHMLSAVKNEDNALFIKGDMVGDSMVYGKGAGRYPTASSVMADIIDIAGNPNIFEINKAMYERVQSKPLYDIAKIGDLLTRYYVRFATVDEPGVLARIASILAKHNISISTVIQIPKTVSKVVTVVMLLHKEKHR